MLGVRGGEDHGRRHVHLRELPRDLQAVDAAHADVEQHQIGLFVVDDVERGFTVAGFADDFVAGEFLQQAL